jgi:hypothetical protein
LDIPTYTGLVQTATFNERQGFYPLASAYVSEANNFMRVQILPAATTLYALEANRLRADEGNAEGRGLVLTAALLLVVVLAGLVLAQLWLSRRFRRTLSPPLVAATAAMLIVGIWFAITLAAQTSGVDNADTNGSGPVSVYTQARIEALQLRADDELTLLTRDSVSTYQASYSRVATALTHLLASTQPGASVTEGARLSQADRDFRAYRSVHNTIRQLDTSGQLGEAVSLASGSGSSDLPTVSYHLDRELATAIASSEHTFNTEMAGAYGGLGALIFAVSILSLIAAALIVLGFRPRLQEYR